MKITQATWEPSPILEEEVETLGLFAARCDVWAMEPTLTYREREELAIRADRFRDLQIAALSINRKRKNK
jgi:hypothetical protein